MSPNLSHINLKVLVMDTDFFALQAINSYLAWDRRTRVTNLSETLDNMWNYIRRTPLAELPDVVILDSDHLGGTDPLRDAIQQLQKKIEDLNVLCLAQTIDPHLIETAADSGAHGFLLKQDVRLQVAWAIVYSLNHDFIVTSGVAKACEGMFNHRIRYAKVLPEQREYPELTDRIRQAIKLCVVEGMPAHLAADEMGISLHTIRGYIKEGYRIMEAYDETEYPIDMTPQERAFMRFTAFADENQLDEESKKRDEDGSKNGKKTP
jgi:DNA-binding NarL/FixJ family response regulator